MREYFTLSFVKIIKEGFQVEGRAGRAPGFGTSIAEKQKDDQYNESRVSSWELESKKLLIVVTLLNSSS